MRIFMHACFYIHRQCNQTPRFHRPACGALMSLFSEVDKTSVGTNPTASREQRWLLNGCFNFNLGRIISRGMLVVFVLVLWFFFLSVCCLGNCLRRIWSPLLSACSLVRQVPDSPCSTFVTCSPKLGFKTGSSLWFVTSCQWNKNQISQCKLNKLRSKCWQLLLGFFVSRCDLTKGVAIRIAEQLTVGNPGFTSFNNLLSLNSRPWIPFSELDPSFSGHYPSPSRLGMLSGPLLWRTYIACRYITRDFRDPLIWLGSPVWISSRTARSKYFVFVSVHLIGC